MSGPGAPRAGGRLPFRRGGLLYVGAVVTLWVVNQVTYFPLAFWLLFVSTFPWAVVTVPVVIRASELLPVWASQSLSLLLFTAGACLNVWLFSVARYGPRRRP